MKTIGELLLLLALVFAGCTNPKDSKSISELQTDTLHAPEAKYLSELQLQNQVDKEIRNILDLANDERITDAVEIISLTEQAVKHILDSSYTAVIRKLEDAIGKATIMVITHPELQLFPLDVEVTTRDLIADVDVLQGVNREADVLTSKGYLQAARHLLKDLASELEIKTPMLPVATYPDALSQAAKALNNGNQEEALIILNTALSTVFVQTKYVPLPLIRAERMLVEVTTLLEKEDSDEDINTLLNNAEYQIKFAEALGYGKRDKEFAEIYSSIKELRKEVKVAERGNSVTLTDNLREKLSIFKSRLITDSKSDNTEK